MSLNLNLDKFLILFNGICDSCIKSSSSVFDNVISELPDISFMDYCVRLHKYFNSSIPMFICVLEYTSRLIDNNIYIHKNHRYAMINILLLITHKYFYDDIYSNSFYAEVGGLSLDTLNTIEVLILKLLNFSVHISNKQYIWWENILNLPVPMINKIISKIKVV